MNFFRLEADRSYGHMLARRKRVERQALGVTCLVLARTLTASAAGPDLKPPVAIADLSLEDLMNVKVTTVTREASTVGQSPAAVFVITQEMIQRSGATEIPELFRMVPGMEVSRINSSEWAVSIRGLGSNLGANLSNKLLVQVDGRTVYNPIFSGVYWDTVNYPLEDIERIEIIRGPGGSVWGANAVNGIINIITKAARDTQGGYANMEAGSWQRGASTVRYGGKTGDGYYRVYGEVFDDAGGHSVGGDQNDRWRSGSTGFRYDGTAKPGETAFTLQGDSYSNEEGHRNNYPTLTPPTYSATDASNTDATGSNLLARWTRQRDENTGWTLQTYYDDTERRGTDGLSDFVVHTGDIDFQQQFALGLRQRFVYGFGYMAQQTQVNGSTIGGGIAITPAYLNVSRNVASTFLQDEIKLKRDLTFTLGSKLEHNAYTGAELEPSARLLYSNSPGHSAWVSASRAVRTPSVLEHDLTVTGAPGAGGPTIVAGLPVFLQIAPNANLDSETVVAYEAGYRAQVNSKWDTDAALFYNHYNNLVVNNTEPGLFFFQPPIISFPLQFQNGATADSYGLELSSNYTISQRWRLSGAYTYLHLKVDPDSNLTLPAVQASAVAFAGESPRNQIYVRSSHDLPRHLQLDVVGRYVDRLPGYTPVIPSYFTMDIQLAWRPRDSFSIAVGGQNLLHNYQQEAPGDPVEVEVPRSVSASVTYRW